MTMPDAVPERRVRVGPKITDAKEPEPAPVIVYYMSPEEIAEKYGPPVKKGDEEVAKIQLTKEQIERAIANTTNVNKAAKELGVGMSTLYKYMNLYGIKAKNSRSGKEDVNMENNSDIITTSGQVEQQTGTDSETEKDYTNSLGIDPQKPVVDAVIANAEQTIERGIYEVFGQNIGRLVDEKQKAYGQAFQKIGQISKILYPNGVSVDKMDDFALIVRVLDKLCRIADGNKEAFGESPWRDIAGYGLLGYVEFE